MAQFAEQQILPDDLVPEVDPTRNELSFTLGDDSGWAWSCSPSQINIKKEPPRPLTVEAPPPWTEAEHIRKIVWRWFHSTPKEVRRVHYIDRSNYLIAQLLANLELALPAVSAEVDGSGHAAFKSLLAHICFELKKIKNPMTHLVKRKSMETQFSKMMQGRHPHSSLCVINAVVHSIMPVATSLEEAKGFLQLLAQQHVGVAQVPIDTLWNALLWELGFS